MSSFFESLNFQPEASGSGTRSGASNKVVRSPRQASSSSSSAIRIDRDTTAPNDPDNATRVFWAAPPSTFVQNWRANNPPQPALATTNDDDQGLVGDQTRQLLVAADQSKLQDHRWSRQQSNSSTSSTASSSKSTKPRRVKSLRASKAEGSFRRHVSSSAALSRSIYEDEDDDSSSQLGSDESFRRSGSSIRRGGEAKNKVQRLLADLSLRVQQIDREDEDQGQGQDEFDEGDLTMLLDCVDESSPYGKGFDPPSSGTVKLSPPKRSIVTSSWERAVTFPPTGSPAGSTGRGSAVHVSTPLTSRSSMGQSKPTFEEQSDDGFDLELDESLLVDLPMLSGKADSAGFFDSIEEDICAISTPPQPVPSPPPTAFKDSVQHQTLPTPQASASSVEAMSNRSLRLGKRRDPPTPGGVSDTQEEPQGMTTRRQINSNRSSKARSISPTKPQKGSALATNVPSSSRGVSRAASPSSMERQVVHPTPITSSEAPLPAREVSKSSANTRQSSRSPTKQQRTSPLTSASTSTTATHLPSASRKMSNSTTTTIPRLSQGIMGGRRPGLSRGSVATGGFKPFRPPTRKIPVEELLAQSHQDSESHRSRSVSSGNLGQRRVENQWTTGEDSSFDEDEISLDAEELEKVMSAKGY